MLTSIENALSTVLALLPPSRPIEIPLAQAVGAYLAQEVRATRDMPPADRSAMDGFAVIAEDLRNAPCELALAGEAAAGSRDIPRVVRGTCVRIFTGATMSPGADAVAIVETTEPGAPGRIRFVSPVMPGDNVRHKGENARCGDLLLPAGTRLGPAQVAACAAVGLDPVTVHEVPSVGVLSTGTEVRPASEPIGEHEVHDSNVPALVAALGVCGVRRVEATSGVHDRLEATRDAIAGLIGRNDCVLVTGGVSKGNYDLVPAAIEAAGGKVHLHRVRIKPGKPFLFATDVDGRPIFGLPGNPLSVLVTFWEFVAPALAKMMGSARDAPLCVRARLTADVTVPGDRVLLALVRLSPDTETGALSATPVFNASSADLAAGGRANAAVKLDPCSSVYAAGTIVEAHPWWLPW